MAKQQLQGPDPALAQHGAMRRYQCHKSRWSHRDGGCPAQGRAAHGLISTEEPQGPN